MTKFMPLAHLDTLEVACDTFMRKPSEWKPRPERGEFGDPRLPTRSLFLRGPKGVSEENWLDDCEIEDYPDYLGWPAMRRLVDLCRSKVFSNSFCSMVLPDQPMGRVMLTVLPPGGAIQWHHDTGPYHDRHARFHVPIATNPGCFLYSGPESRHLPVGQLTWFNNRQLHTAVNFGDTDRIHLIFEMAYKCPLADPEDRVAKGPKTMRDFMKMGKI